MPKPHPGRDVVLPGGSTVRMLAERLKRIETLCVEEGFPFPDGARPVVVMFRLAAAAELYRLASGKPLKLQKKRRRRARIRKAAP